MDAYESPRLCPHCFMRDAGERCRTCGEATAAFGNAAGAPTVIGRLRLLVGAAPDLTDLAADWSGPRRFPCPPWGPATPTALCRHHQGRMIWLWEAYWPGAFADADSARALRALRQSSALVLELPVPDDASFRAAFARNGVRAGTGEGPGDERTNPGARAARPVLSTAAELLEELDRALEAVGAKPRRIAIVHPKPAAAQLAQLQMQWSHWGGQIHGCTDVHEAINWCIGDPRVPAATDPVRLGVRRRGPLEIGVLDLGGWLGRDLLVALHRLGPGPHSQLDLLVSAAEDPAASPQAYLRFLENLPTPLLTTPPWRGIVQRGWRRQRALRVALIEDPAGIPPPMVVALAVGHNRLSGEQLLARLLDLDYGRRGMLLLLKDDRSDPQLLEWIRRDLGAPILSFDPEAATAKALRLIACCL